MSEEAYRCIVYIYIYYMFMYMCSVTCVIRGHERPYIHRAVRESPARRWCPVGEPFCVRDGQTTGFTPAFSGSFFGSHRGSAPPMVAIFFGSLFGSAMPLAIPTTTLPCRRTAPFAAGRHLVAICGTYCHWAALPFYGMAVPRRFTPPGGTM